MTERAGFARGGRRSIQAIRAVCASAGAPAEPSERQRRWWSSRPGARLLPKLAEAAATPAEELAALEPAARSASGAFVCREREPGPQHHLRHSGVLL